MCNCLARTRQTAPARWVLQFSDCRLVWRRVLVGQNCRGSQHFSFLVFKEKFHWAFGVQLHGMHSSNCSSAMSFSSSRLCRVATQIFQKNNINSNAANATLVVDMQKLRCCWVTHSHSHSQCHCDVCRTRDCDHTVLLAILVDFFFKNILNTSTSITKLLSGISSLSKKIDLFRLQTEPVSGHAKQWFWEKSRNMVSSTCSKHTVSVYSNN